jgi:hypothetical protein
MNSIRKFGIVFIWTGVAGMLICFAWFIYSAWLWWETPVSPDTSHVIPWKDHGNLHYLTTSQDRFYSQFALAAVVGWAVFFVCGIGGGFLHTGGKPDSSASQRPWL